MKKNQIFMLLLGIINTAVCLSLLLLCVPNRIALMVDINENISFLTTKWILLINVILPLVLSIVVCCLKNKQKAIWVLSLLFVFVLYENMLAFSYFSVEKNFVLGSRSQIPIAVSFFMPISVILLIFGIKLKNLPFGSKIGIRTKYSTKTEFIWKQTHYFAKDIFMAYGFLSFIVSLIFIFVRMPYINLALDVIGLLTCFFITNKQAKIMYRKYMQMEKNKAKSSKIKLSTN